MGFINVLTKHRKILYYQKIFKEFNKIIDEENGLTEVEVITSEALTQKAQDSIKEKLMNSLNIKIKLKKIVKKDIIGGIIIKIKSMMIDNSIKLEFDNVGFGLINRGDRIDQFEIAGSNKQYYRGSVTVKKNHVFVYSDSVKNPKFVRYAWSDTPEPTLFNTEGFPSSSFMIEID